MGQGKVRVERDGPIGRLVLDNPDRRNALSADMWRAIPIAMRDFDADPDIRCVVVRGAGTVAFAAGADISEFEKQRSGPELVHAYEQLLEDAHASLEGSRKPVIALIHGFCIGGGLATALSCDLRYVSDTAQFAVPAARLGLGYGVRGHARIVATVGHAAAREIMFTARRYSASEALAIGLVNRVVPEAELDTYVNAMATTIASNAPLTQAASKTIIDTIIAPHGDFSAGKAAIARCMDSEDYKEGRQAFLEKRPPKFRGV